MAKQIEAKSEPTERFWRNAGTWESNPILILAKIVAEKVGGVKFVYPGERNKENSLIMGGVQINTTRQSSRSVLDDVARYPLLVSLVRADDANYGRFDESWQSCQELNDQLNAQIEALYWRNKAAYFQRSADYYQSLVIEKADEESDFAASNRELDEGSVAKSVAKANEALAMARDLLGGLLPLTDQDIHSLIEEAVEEKLTPHHQL